MFERYGANPIDATASNKCILILGGGFGGVATARPLEGLFRRRPGVEIVLVSRDNYLVTGHADAALAQLKAVVAQQPDDRVARRLLAMLSPAPAPPPVDGDAAPGRTPPPAQLVGRWRGDRDESTFDLNLDGRGRFVWQAARDGMPTTIISGAYACSGGTLTLKADDRPSLRVSIVEFSPDLLRLRTAADIPGDPGLGFRRVNEPAAPDGDPRGGPRDNR